MRPLATTVGVAAAAGAAQMGIAYGLAVLLWTREFDAPGDAAWAANLTWVCWLAATSVVIGAIAGGRVNSAAGLKDTPWLQIATAAASAVGALVTVPLAAIPARYALLAADPSPAGTAARLAAIGVLLGAVVAVGVLLGRPLAWNAIATTGWLWLVALVSVVVALLTGTEPAAVRLGIWSIGETTPGWFLVMVPMLLAAFALGAGIAWLAKRQELNRVAVAVCGAPGPLLVAVAYLVAGPGARPETGEQFLPYLAAPYAVLTGLLGSLLVAAIEKPTAEESSSEAEGATEAGTAMLPAIPAAPYRDDAPEAYAGPRQLAAGSDGAALGGDDRDGPRQLGAGSDSGWSDEPAEPATWDADRGGTWAGDTRPVPSLRDTSWDDEPDVPPVATPLAVGEDAGRHTSRHAAWDDEDPTDATPDDVDAPPQVAPAWHVDVPESDVDRPDAASVVSEPAEQSRPDAASPWAFEPQAPHAPHEPHEPHAPHEAHAPLPEAGPVPSWSHQPATYEPPDEPAWHQAEEPFHEPAQPAQSVQPDQLAQPEPPSRPSPKPSPQPAPSPPAEVDVPPAADEAAGDAADGAVAGQEAPAEQPRKRRFRFGRGKSAEDASATQALPTVEPAPVEAPAAHPEAVPPAPVAEPAAADVPDKEPDPAGWAEEERWLEQIKGDDEPVRGATFRPAPLPPERPERRKWSLFGDEDDFPPADPPLDLDRR